MMNIERLQEQFNYYFDDVQGDIVLNGLRFSASDVLKKMDPCAYREEFLLYCDVMDINLEECV